MTAFRTTVQEAFMAIQDSICNQIAATDGGEGFIEDSWERPGGGGGRSRVLQHGKAIEKGGVNFSAVYGELDPRAQKALQVEGSEFFATGVSIVMHPQSPMVPIIHMNIRYFELTNGKAWFGGGIDLTPHYIVPQQAAWFHQQLKTTCDQFDAAYYPKFKTWADDYFYITHREETRGIGGIFFDRLSFESEEERTKIFEFTKAVGNTFAPTYSQLIQQNRELPFGEAEKLWQSYRRGRYVEFNLVLDRGTKFGLETNGRVESILMSLPFNASWPYNYQAEAGSREEFTLNNLKKGINWLEFA